jgi:methylated-DNA-[protein]-cysteine S-methyltransferase
MKQYYNSPIGWLSISTSDDFLTSIHFLDEEPELGSSDSNAIIQQTITELSEYFEGNRTQFSIPLKPEGSEFQQTVWAQLQQIPYGQTTTYGTLAEKLGNPNKVRAVGKANGQNPIPIIIPCHRVIGADNRLVGYAGGIARKKFLLKHEGALLL